METKQRHSTLLEIEIYSFNNLTKHTIVVWNIFEMINQTFLQFSLLAVPEQQSNSHSYKPTTNRFNNGTIDNELHSLKTFNYKQKVKFSAFSKKNTNFNREAHFWH